MGQETGVDIIKYTVWLSPSLNIYDKAQHTHPFPEAANHLLMPSQHTPMSSARETRGLEVAPVTDVLNGFKVKGQKQVLLR